MKLSQLFDDQGSFHGQVEILEKIAQSANFQSDIESISDDPMLLLFKTSKQQTWLVATSKRLYCLLDDARTGELKLVWSMSKSSLVDENDSLVKFSTRQEYKANTGLIDFGPKHKNWLYSKALFNGEDPAPPISAFISNKIFETDLDLG